MQKVKIILGGVKGQAQRRKAMARINASFISEVMGVQLRYLSAVQRDGVRALHHFGVLYVSTHGIDSAAHLRADLETAWQEGLDAAAAGDQS